MSLRRGRLAIDGHPNKDLSFCRRAEAGARAACGRTSGMPYVENMTVHDADTHIMELPDCLDAFIDPPYREKLLAHIHGAKKSKLADTSWADEAIRQHQDPEFMAEADQNIMTRKRYEALGSFRKDERKRALDQLGFA